MSYSTTKVIGQGCLGDNADTFDLTAYGEELRDTAPSSVLEIRTYPEQGQIAIIHLSSRVEEVDEWTDRIFFEGTWVSDATKAREASFDAFYRNVHSSFVRVFTKESE